MSIDPCVLCLVQQRDSGRNFVLGERVQYVLLSGHRTQDEAAEDPLTAGLQSLSPDYELYWRNKLMKPLQEIFATCLSISEQQVGLSVEAPSRPYMSRAINRFVVWEICLGFLKALFLTPKIKDAGMTILQSGTASSQLFAPHW